MDDASAQTAPLMHHLQPLPLRHDAQFVCFEHAEPPAGAVQPSALAVQSALSHELTAGPLLVPEKHELLLLHHPQPGFATHAPHVGVSVAQSSCDAGGFPGCGETFAGGWVLFSG